MTAQRGAGSKPFPFEVSTVLVEISTIVGDANMEHTQAEISALKQKSRLNNEMTLLYDL